MKKVRQRLTVAYAATHKRPRPYGRGAALLTGMGQLRSYDTMTDEPQIRDVLDFWFSPDVKAQWWKPEEGFDDLCREHFAALHGRAASGALDAWAETADGALALVILLDQIPRNIHRGTPGAFATDAKARIVAEAVIDKGLHELQPTGRRVFYFMPFEHSEDLADQERSVALMKTLGDEGWNGYAQQHRDIVARFGRFPHRNAILGRESTPEEIEFLKQPGSSF